MKKSERQKFKQQKGNNNDIYILDIDNYDIDDDIKKEEKRKAKSKQLLTNKENEVESNTKFDLIKLNFMTEFKYLGLISKDKEDKEDKENKENIEKSEGKTEKDSFFIYDMMNIYKNLTGLFKPTCQIHPEKILDGMIISKGYSFEKIRKMYISNKSILSLKERELLSWKTPVSDKLDVLKIVKKIYKRELNSDIYSQIVNKSQTNEVITYKIDCNDILNRYESNEDKLNLTYTRTLHHKFKKIHDLLKENNLIDSEGNLTYKTLSPYNITYIFKSFFTYDILISLIYLSNKKLKTSESFSEYEPALTVYYVNFIYNFLKSNKKKLFHSSISRQTWNGFKLNINNSQGIGVNKNKSFYISPFFICFLLSVVNKFTPLPIVSFDDFKCIQKYVSSNNKENSKEDEEKTGKTIQKEEKRSKIDDFCDINNDNNDNNDNNNDNKVHESNQCSSNIVKKSMILKIIDTINKESKLKNENEKMLLKRKRTSQEKEKEKETVYLKLKEKVNIRNTYYEDEMIRSYLNLIDSFKEKKEKMNLNESLNKEKNEEGDDKANNNNNKSKYKKEFFFNEDKYLLHLLSKDVDIFIDNTNEDQRVIDINNDNDKEEEENT